MVVRRQMSQRERVAARIQSSVRVARPVPVDDGMEDMDSVRRRIASGRAFLRIVEYPWGVEFDVGEVVDQA
jgi:hypothetical protein